MGDQFIYLLFIYLFIHLLFIYSFIYLFIIYLFIQGFVQSSTRAKTIGHKSPTRFKLQPNPLLK